MIHRDLIAATVILQGKKILQDCWRQKFTWDEPLKVEILDKWKKWGGMLPLMLKWEIPDASLVAKTMQDVAFNYITYVMHHK